MATARRSAAPQARRGKRERSGAVARRSSRDAPPAGAAATGPGRARAAARTTGALPRRTSIQPSAASCAYASLTTPRGAAAWVKDASPVITTGCGTSEHAAMAGALLLGSRARDAFEAALDPQDGGILIGVSHEGGTAATLAALAAAQDARTVLIT